MDHGRFGWGSMLGSWLGGKLSDKIGFTESWFSVYSPAEYCCFSYNTYEVWGLCAMFIIMTVADVSSRDVCLLATYSKPENRTRS
jgi:predicted MFS family arabinose efflux permease